MLQDSGRSRVIACHSREIGNILLSLGIYKMVERKMVTGQGYGLGIGGCKRLCPAAAGHSLVIRLFLSMSVKDRSLHWMIGKSHTYYSEHILGYGRLEDLLLSYRGSGSFQTDC